VVLGRILAGLVVFAIGLFLANLAFNIITSSGDRQAQILGQVVAIIAGVSHGTATNRHCQRNSQFSLWTATRRDRCRCCLTGLGSRDIAAEQFAVLDSFKQQQKQAAFKRG